MASAKRSGPVPNVPLSAKEDGQPLYGRPYKSYIVVYYEKRSETRGLVAGWFTII